MTKLLTAEQLAELARFNTPTISNAIELFNIRRRDRGFLPHTIRCLLPDLGPMVGYAVTSVTTASPPDCGPTADHLPDYLRYVASVPGPKVAVGQDIDEPAGLGAQFGEVTAGIHKQLGCVGHITSGCPRDLDEVGAMGFSLFGLNPCVSHAYVRLIDFGKPVAIAGVMIRPGDLLHGDKHGVCIIPHEVADRLADACRKIEEVEKPAIEYARRAPASFDLEEYIRIRQAMKPAAHE
ncbi:MAG: RraA family protein [Isosphaeraceae bacterium]